MGMGYNQMGMGMGGYGRGGPPDTSILNRYHMGVGNTARQFVSQFDQEFDPVESAINFLITLSEEDKMNYQNNYGQGQQGNGFYGYGHQDQSQHGYPPNGDNPANGQMQGGYDPYYNQGGYQHQHDQNGYGQYQGNNGYNQGYGGQQGYDQGYGGQPVQQQQSPPPPQDQSPSAAIQLLGLPAISPNKPMHRGPAQTNGGPNDFDNSANGGNGY